MILFCTNRIKFVLKKVNVSTYKLNNYEIKIYAYHELT